MMANRALLAVSNQGPPPAAPATLAYAGSASASFGSSVTLTNVPIGAASADREVFILVGIVPGSTYRSLTAATIGGVAATVHGQSDDTTFKWNVALISAPLATGTTATVVLTFSGSGSGNVYLNTYAVTGLLSSTPVDLQTNKWSNTQQAATLETAVAVTSGGVAFFAAMVSSSLNNYFVSGVNQDFSTVVDSFNPQGVALYGGSITISEDSSSYVAGIKAINGTDTHYDRQLMASFR